MTNTEVSTKLEDSKKTETSTKLDAPIAVPNSDATLPAPDSTDVSKVTPFTLFSLTPVQGYIFCKILWWWGEEKNWLLGKKIKTEGFGDKN